MPNLAVHKTAQVESLDEFFSGSPDELRAVYEYALGLMDTYDDRPLSEITAHIERADTSQSDGPTGPRDVGSAEHFFEHWLSDSSALDGTSVDRVFRQGYRTAIERALAYPEPVPIETIWVSGEGEAFEIHVVEGARQVTVVVRVPVPTDRLVGAAGGQAAKLSNRGSWAVYPGPASEPGAEVLESGVVTVLRRQTGGAGSSGA